MLAQDHLDFGPTYRINVQGFNFQNNPAYAAELVAEYTANRTGVLTSPGVEFLAWEKLPEPYRSNLSATALSQLNQFPADWPEIEYEISQAILGTGMSPYEVFGTILSIIVAPISRGNVTLRSNDTSDLPIVNPNFLEAETDQQLAIQMMKRDREIGSQSSILPVIFEEVSPGPNVTTDAELLNFVKNSAFQNWHASCTCRSTYLLGQSSQLIEKYIGKMGMTNDTTAVVDSRGRVIGAHRLRIADASMFAMLPPGHPTSTVCKFGRVYKFSEKGLILSRYGRGKDCILHETGILIGHLRCCSMRILLSHYGGLRHQICRTCNSSGV